MNPQKGKVLGGECNRKQCFNPAMWWNPSTCAFYCVHCAKAINTYAPGLCVDKADK